MPQPTDPRPPGHHSERPPKPAPPPSYGRAPAASAAAERDLLAAILEAAAADRLEEQLPPMAASLRRYSGCRCAGLVLADGDGLAAATCGSAGGAEFHRLPAGSLPASDALWCAAFLPGVPGRQAGDFRHGEALLRNGRPEIAAGGTAAPSGICAGRAFFQSVALVPVRRRERILGFMFVGDERPERISARAAAFMTRAGAYLGNMLRPPGPAGITDRIRTEGGLERSEERYRLLVENANEAIAVVQDGMVKYVSPRIEQVSGYQVAEVIDRPLSGFVHPEDWRRVGQHMASLLGRQAPSQTDQFRLIDKDGGIRWGQVNAVLVDWEGSPAILALMADITDRKRMEQHLEESERRYRLLAENASDVIFTTDLNMTPTYVSPSCFRLTGYTAEEACAMDLKAWLAPGSRDPVFKKYAGLLSRARAGAVLTPSQRTATVEMNRKGGGTIWSEARIEFLHDAAGAVTGLIGVARDVTERRAAEMERERRMQLEALITETSTAFISLPTESIDAAIHNALAAIAWFTAADRSCIYTFSADGTTLSLQHEWHSGRTEPLTGRLDQMTADCFPRLMARIGQARSVQITGAADADAAGEETALLEGQDARSLVLIPMMEAGRPIGLLSLAAVDTGKVWESETMTALRVVAEMFSNALERKRMDQALRESERRYRLLAENITDVIWTTDMGPRITYMSPSAQQLVGYSAEELARLTVSDLLTPDSLRRGMAVLAERQVAEGQASGDRAQGGPAHWLLEVEMRRKDGSTFWAEEQVSFMRDEQGTPTGLLGVTRDITQRKAMQEALRLSEQKYRLLVESSPDGVLCTDRYGAIIDCNLGLSRMLGYDRDELRSMRVAQLMTPRDLTAGRDYLSRLVSGKVMELETEIVRRDGRPLPVWAKVVMLADAPAADFQTIAYFRDFADRRKIDEMKDEFVGLVSHELRSPLTVIIGALNTAISEGPRLSPGEINQLLQDAALEAEQLSHLVGNLLELSRAQADRLLLHVEPVNLSQTVNKVVKSVERQSPGRRFVVDLPARLPPVPADQLRLERVLHNLLENSVKYSPPDTPITVSATNKAGRLVVSVTDQGPGISAEDQAKLFKPFQQLGNPLLDHTKGAGLGLLVCRRLVEAHGGRIWVESEPGHGATFSFTIEAAESPPAAGQDRPGRRR